MYVFFRCQLILTFFVLTPIFLSTGRGFVGSRLTKIAEVRNYSNNETRDILNSFDTNDQKEEGMPIDPFDFMNRLKQVGAMNNATTPSDALDEALNAFDQSVYENVPIK